MCMENTLLQTTACYFKDSLFKEDETQITSAPTDRVTKLKRREYFYPFAESHAGN